MCIRDRPKPARREYIAKKNSSKKRPLGIQSGDDKLVQEVAVSYTHLRKTKPLGHYGRLRKAYLEMRRPILFNELVLSDKL